MTALSQSEALEALRRSYGGSDNTRPSFLRPQYVAFNTPQKSRDFGARDNLNVVISGELGAELGAPTLFFKVDCRQPVELRIVKGRINSRTDPHLSVSISDSQRRPLELDEAGFARRVDIYSTPEPEDLARQPAGTYYFSVSSSQWQRLPFSVALLVISYQELAGSTSLSGGLVGRLAAAKLRGSAGGSGPLQATLTSPTRIRALGGATGGSGPLRGSLAIPRGAATGQLLLEGRLKQFHRLQGAAGGSAPLRGELTVTGGGGGYGY